MHFVVDYDAFTENQFKNKQRMNKYADNKLKAHLESFHQVLQLIWMNKHTNIQKLIPQKNFE